MAKLHPPSLLVEYSKEGILIKHMIATITCKLIELVSGTDQSKHKACRINISAPQYRELRLEHPMCKLAFSHPRDLHDGDKVDSLPIYSSPDKDPAHVGEKITVGLVQKTDLLSRFELDDHNFPSEGTHTQIDLEVMEKTTTLSIKYEGREELLIFNRVNDYYQVGAPK